MRQFHAVLLTAVFCSIFGCGSDVAEPVEMTPDVEAAIAVEDAQVRAEESQQKN